MTDNGRGDGWDGGEGCMLMMVDVRVKRSIQGLSAVMLVMTMEVMMEGEGREGGRETT